MRAKLGKTPKKAREKPFSLTRTADFFDLPSSIGRSPARKNQQNPDRSTQGALFSGSLTVKVPPEIVEPELTVKIPPKLEVPEPTVTTEPKLEVAEPFAKVLPKINVPVPPE